MAQSNALGGGIRGQAYLGTNARTPPNLWKFKTDPTDFTIAGYSPGDFWLNTETESLFYLASVEATIASGGQQIANWVELSEGVDPVLDILTDAGTAIPVGGEIEILGGSNINTSAATNVVTIDLDNTVSVSGSITAGTGLTTTTGNVTITAGNLALPNTNGAGTQGEITFGGNRWISNIGTRNTFVGQDSGNTTTGGISNTGIGANALQTLSILTTGNTCVGANAGQLIGGVLSQFNTSIGAGSLATLSIGDENCAMGAASLGSLSTGNYSCAIGHLSGSNYTGAESSNIIIGHGIGGVLGESNTLRIGLSTGSGASQLNRAFIQGIAGVSTINSEAVSIDTVTGQLGSYPPGGFISYNIIAFGDSPYTALATDVYIAVDTTLGAVTVRLPNTAQERRIFIIKDYAGTASTNNITITTVAGLTNIDGATSFVMNTDYESVQIIGNSSTYEVF